MLVVTTVWVWWLMNLIRTDVNRYLCVCMFVCRVKLELIKPAVDWRKAGVKVNTMGAAVAAKA